MKKIIGRLHLLTVLLAALVLAGCVNRVQDPPSVYGTVIRNTETEEETEEPVEEEPVEEEPVEEEPEPEPEETESPYPKAIVDAGYEEIAPLAGNGLYAVRDGGLWYVVDNDNGRVFDEGYDYFTTDQDSYFSLTVSAGGEYVSTLYHRDPRSGEVERVYVNDEFPEFDIVGINAPYLKMGERDRNGEAAVLPALYLEWEDFGDGGDYEVYWLIHLTVNNVTQGGFDPARWTGLSDFSDDIDGIGGIFIDCPDYYFDPETDTYYNIIGCNSGNEVLFAEDEKDGTVEILPYVPTADGYYAGYMINATDNTRTLAYGNIRSGIFSRDEMTAFPEEVVRVAPCTGDQAQGSWICVYDADDNEKIFDMSKGDYVDAD